MAEWVVDRCVKHTFECIDVLKRHMSPPHEPESHVDMENACALSSLYGLTLSVKSKAVVRRHGVTHGLVRVCTQGGIHGKLRLRKFNSRTRQVRCATRGPRHQTGGPEPVHRVQSAPRSSSPNPPWRPSPLPPCLLSSSFLSGSRSTSAESGRPPKARPRRWRWYRWSTWVAKGSAIGGFGGGWLEHPRQRMGAQWAGLSLGVPSCQEPQGTP